VEGLNMMWFVVFGGCIVLGILIACIFDEESFFGLSAIGVIGIVVILLALGIFSGSKNQETAAYLVYKERITNVSIYTPHLSKAYVYDISRWNVLIKINKLNYKNLWSGIFYNKTLAKEEPVDIKKFLSGDF
jgi:hypothetical protein